MSRDRHPQGAPAFARSLVEESSSQPSDRRGRFPDFLIIGAGRCGTTTLADHLAEHPNIFMCEPKEPFYFSHESVYAQGDDWYRGLFARSRPGQVCGEASTSYSVWPDCGDVAGRIAKTIPEAKLIYIMRHPVERVYSCYDFDSVRLGLKMTFEEVLAKDDHLINGCLYLNQINQYLRHYPRSSFLFLFLEDLAANYQKTLAVVWDFLGVGPPPTAPSRRLDNSRAEHYVRVHTTQRLRRLPGVGRIAEAMPRRWKDGFFQVFRRTPVYRWVARRHKIEPMRPETRKRLLEVFEAPNRELAEFLNRDLSAWSR